MRSFFSCKDKFWAGLLDICCFKLVPQSLLQVATKRLGSGLVNFVTALAYHFCLNLPAIFTQLGDHLLSEPCRL